MPNYTTNKTKTKHNPSSRRLRSSSASRVLDQQPTSVIVPISSAATTTTNKRRIESNELSPTNSTKAPEAKKANMSTITLADLTRLLEQQTASIKSDFQLEMKTMSDDLKASFHSEITKLNDRVDAIESSVSSQLSSLKTDIVNCENRLNGTDDDFARIAKLNELKISGIAHSTNEKLHDILSSIAKIIGYDIANPSNIPEIVRMQRKNYQTNEIVQMPLIVLKFIAPHIRNKFYALYITRISKEPILTEHLNLAQGGTVRIGEVLTPNNQTIFTEALKLKREKKLFKVNTMDGLVRVKSEQADKFVIIRSSRALDVYVATKIGSASAPSPASTNDMVNASTSQDIDQTVRELQQQQHQQQLQHEQRHLQQLQQQQQQQMISSSAASTHTQPTALNSKNQSLPMEIPHN